MPGPGAFASTAFQPGDALPVPRGRLCVVAGGALRRGDATLAAGGAGFFPHAEICGLCVNVLLVADESQGGGVAFGAVAPTPAPTSAPSPVTFFQSRRDPPKYGPSVGPWDHGPKGLY